MPLARRARSRSRCARSAPSSSATRALRRPCPNLLPMPSLRKSRPSHLCRTTTPSSFALDEGALLAHLDLDRARLARGIGLLDLAGGLGNQGDLLAIPLGNPVAGLQMGQKLLLIGLGQGIRRGGFDLSRRLELVKQDFRGFLEFAGKLVDSITGHIWFVPP